jgi:DNA helicase-4
MVLTQTDEYPFGEERRLFYVALTRARCKTYLVCMTGLGQSPFATELEVEKEYRIEVQGVNTKKLTCGKCKSGIMLLRDGVNGKFYGCSNFPLCNNTQQTCPECGTGLMVPGDNRQWECNSCGYLALNCPRCHTGILLQKNGSRGPFLGCSNFRDPEINCRYTENVA